MTTYDGPAFEQPAETDAVDERDAAAAPRVRPVLATIAVVVAALALLAWIALQSGLLLLLLVPLGEAPASALDLDRLGRTVRVVWWSLAGGAVALALASVVRREAGRLRAGLALGVGVGVACATFASLVASAFYGNVLP